MKGCNWEEIHGFSTPGEYRRFCDWLESQVAVGLVEKIPVRHSKKEVPFGSNEKWFRCKESGEAWRLVAPDAPFAGFWAEVE